MAHAVNADGRPDWAGRRVLDIGAGTGWAVDEVRRMGASLSMGIDPSIKHFFLAQECYPDAFMVYSTLEGFKTRQRFDRIFSIMSLQHIDNLRLGMTKVHDLLVPGGDFMAIVPNYDYFRLPRHGYEVEITEIDSLQYVTTIKRETGTISDIVRKEIAYVLAGDVVGLDLLEAKSMRLDDILIRQLPKYKNYRGNALFNFLRFRRKTV